MNYFPNGSDEISLIKFIAKYQYLNVNDAKYFFSSQKYYRVRVSKLIQKEYLNRSKLVLTLSVHGIEYAKLLNFEYNTINRNNKYKERLLRLSNIAAFYHSCNTISFTPSFAIKDKTIFTTTARKFIGIINVSGFDYLAYQITAKHNNKYIISVLYDIQKEKKYRNIIIFINDIKRINLNDFIFGNNQVLIIQDNEQNREKLKYLHSISWFKIIQKYYKSNIYLSEYNFCDYTDNKNKYVSTFYFFDTEKINRIKYFLRENKNKNIDIICSSDLEHELKKELPDAIYCIVDLEKYIDKEINVYD